MNLKLLLNRQAINTVSTRLLSLLPNFIYRDFSASPSIFLSDRVHTQNPNVFTFKRNLHSVQEIKFNELSFKPRFDSDDSVENDDNEDGNMSEFLSRFVYVMRGKLSDVYPDCDKQTIDGMLLIIVGKVVSEMEKGIFERTIAAASGTATWNDFSEDLWRTVWEVSNSVLEDMEKERRKENMKGFLQSEEVKELCRFAGEIGIRGDMLRELRFKWASEEMDESEFYASVEKLREEERAQEKEETDSKNAEPIGEEVVIGEEKPEPEVMSLPKRHGKIRYKIYGLDLSDPKWVEVADKIHETGEIVWPQEPKPINGKTKLVTEKILSLKEEDDPSQLLAEWAELLQPNRVDYMTLLDKLKEQNRQLYFKVAEHLLSEKSFQPSIRDYSVLIDAHATENRLEDAERILKKMNESGILPDILTATILVHMYSKAGNLDRAKEAFESLRSHGFQLDMKVYNSMIMAYVNAGQPKLAESLIWQMDASGLKPTEEILMALLRSFAQFGHAKEAVDGANGIANMMQSTGFQLSVESCALLIEVHGRYGQPDQARSRFDNMIKNGLRPDDRCTASMIAAYEKKNWLDKALDLLLQLEKDGFEPGPATCTILVDWFCKLQLVDEAEQLLGKIAEQGEAPPFKIQVSLCDMYARAKNEKKALQALGVLEARKEQLGSDDFERVIIGLNAGGFVQEARRVQALMEAQGYATTSSLNVAFFSSEILRRKGPTSFL